MPSRVHRGKIPARIVDHTLAHPWLVPFASYWVAAGLYVLAGSVNGTDMLPEAGKLTEIWLSAQLVAGGLFALVGVYWRGTDSMSWTLRVIGVILALGCWGTWLAYEDDIYFRAISLAFSAGCLIEVTAAFLNREGYHREMRQLAKLVRRRG